MGIRETLEKHSKIVTAVVLVVVVAAGFFLLRTVDLNPDRAGIKNMFYSDDDGASFFAGNNTDIITNQKKSKPAYRAVVYAMSSDRHRFVGYLARMPDSALEAIDAADAKAEQLKAKYSTQPSHPELLRALEDAVIARQSAVAKTEVKRPGASNKWTSSNSAEGTDIMGKIIPPQGYTGDSYMVYPE